MKREAARTFAGHRGVVLAGIASIVLACSGAPSTSTPPSPGTAADTCPSTPEELRYGCPLSADGTITFQPDVVTVRGGSSAIRSQGSDGVSWTIDASAPGADAIAVGKVLYVTDRAVGRVLKVSSENGTIQVVLGPAELGEIIRDGELRWDEPVSLANPDAFAAPDLPGIGTDVTEESSAFLHPAALVSYRQPRNTSFGVAEDGPPPIDINVDPDNSLSAFCCTPIAGAILNLDQGGIRLEGGIWLELKDAEIMGYAKMKNGHFTDGVIQITGVTGIHFEFRSATAKDRPPDNFRRLYVVPVEYRAAKKAGAKRGARIPLVKQAWQAYLIRTAFSAGSTSMKGTGDYTLDSNVLAVSFKDGDIADLELPTKFTTATSLLDSLTGVSVGVNGFTLSWVIQFCLCIGTNVNSNGIYIQLEPSFGVSNDSSAVGVLGGRCRSVTFRTAARVGAGHFLPSSWVDSFNDAYGLSGKSAMTATAGVTQDVELWDEVASVPEGIRRCS